MFTGTLVKILSTTLLNVVGIVLILGIGNLFKEETQVKNTLIS
jgi:hypothetical protein